MKVTIREEAADDLEAAYAWVARESLTAAADLVERVRERIGRLATPGLSHMGRFGRVSGTRELVEPPYIIVYQVQEDREEIVVIAIFHARRHRS